MVRVTNGKQRHKRHHKIIAQAKGFRQGRKNIYNQAKQAITKQGQRAYVGRKEKKRVFRSLWIERLSAVLRLKDSKYSVFMHEMDQKNVKVNRKVLSNIAIAFPKVFDKFFVEVSSK